MLNLAGLGAGFAYLGRWWSAAACAGVTVLLVVLAFATDAADQPWLWRVLAVLWLGSMAFAAWWLARRTRPGPLSPESRLLPLIVGAALVVVLVGGYIGYGAAGAQTYAEGVGAQARADCPSAITKFDLVTGPYELTLSPDVAAAEGSRAQCAAFLAASQAEERGAYTDAVARYQEFTRAFPGTVLVDFVRANLERTYNAWALMLRRSGDYPAAIKVYRELLGQFGSAQVRNDLAATYGEQAVRLRTSASTGAGATRAAQARDAVAALLVIWTEFRDTPSGPAVPQAIVDTFNAANGLFVESQFCEALPVLDYFAGAVLGDADTTGLVGTANAQRAATMLECGLARYRESAHSEATTQLEALIAAYPNGPQVAQARSAIIAATVSEANGGEPLPLPAPLGDNAPGSIPVTFYNDSPVEQHVYVVGPTAHEFTLPPCPTCPQSYLSLDTPLSGDPCSSVAGLPSLTLRLDPGTYSRFSTSSVDSTSVESSPVDPGFEYTTCVYIGSLF